MKKLPNYRPGFQIIESEEARKNLIGIADAAERLGINRNQLRRWVDAGVIEAVLIYEPERWFHPDVVEATRLLIQLDQSEDESIGLVPADDEVDHG